VQPAETGRPSFHPSVHLKLSIYGYLNRVQSSRRLEREAGRNLEVLWLLGRLVPDDKVIADFRKDNGPAIRKVCARFVELCRRLGLLGAMFQDVLKPSAVQGAISSISLRGSRSRASISMRSSLGLRAGVFPALPFTRATCAILTSAANSRP
jgi:Transposase domain (DUF772)